jgi:hypothetical protein
LGVWRGREGKALRGAKYKALFGSLEGKGREGKTLRGAKYEGK